MDTKLLFETSIFGINARVYQNRVSFKPFIFSAEQSIPVNQIASVEVAMPGVQQVTIETTGGKRINIVVKMGDKDKFRDAIFEAQQLNK